MRILLVGAGGVGAAFAAIARRRDFFEAIVVADHDAGSAERAAAVDDRFSAARVDASTCAATNRSSPRPSAASASTARRDRDSS